MTGRPYKDSDDLRVITFRLKLTKDERQRLAELAEEQGQTPSQYVRSRIFDRKPGDRRPNL